MYIQDKELEDQKREEAAKYDNYVIKNLEKQLHLKKKNNSTKLPSAFVECGLAGILFLFCYFSVIIRSTRSSICCYDSKCN